MASFITKLNYNANGNLVNNEVVTLVDSNKVWIFEHHNVMQGKGITVWTNPNQTGTQITDFVVSQDSTKSWVWKMTFGAGVLEGTYYVRYYSQGDENDADDINRLNVAVDQTQQSLFDIVGSAIFADANSPLDVKLDSTGIVLPVQINMADRELATQTTVALASNGYFVGNTIDCISVKRLCGHISTDQAGTLYFQQSDDNADWRTASSTAISAGTSATLGGTAYFTSTNFDYTVTSRYARLLYVNGATAQTRLLLSGYKAVL